MGSLRTVIAGNRWLAALLLAAVLCLKAILPAGYMIASASHVLTVTVCAESAGGQVVHQIVLPGKPQPLAPKGNAQDKCPQAPLGMAMLAGGDLLLVALAVAFAMAFGLAPLALPLLRRRTWLRPPPIGPPAAA